MSDEHIHIPHIMIDDEVHQPDDTHTVVDVEQCEENIMLNDNDGLNKAKNFAETTLHVVTDIPYAFLKGTILKIFNK